MRIPSFDQYSIICEAQTSFGLMVQRWSCRDVANWLRGLDDCLLPYIERFIESKVDGRELLMMTPADLQDIGVKSVGAQRTVTQALSLLCHLCYDMETENLQTLTSAVSVQSRNLLNELKNSSDIYRNSNFGALPNNILLSISSLAEKTKKVVFWLDRHPFAADLQYIDVRNSFLKLAIDIVEAGAKVTKNAEGREISKNIQMLCSHCTQLSTICDQLIEEANDPLVIQTAYLDRAEISKRTSSEELGCQIETTCDGVHLVKDIKFQTPADLCRKIESGDEIVEINGQTVIGWCQNKLRSVLTSNRNLRIALLLKKRPKDSWNIYKTTPSTPKPRKHRNPLPKAPSPSSSTSGLTVFAHRRRSSSFTVVPGMLSGMRQTLDSKSTSPASPASPVPTIRLNSDDNDEEPSGDDRQRRATVSGGSPTLKRLSLHVNRKSSLVPPPPRSPGQLQRHSMMNDQKPPLPHFVFSADGRRQNGSPLLPIKYSTSSISSNEDVEKSTSDDEVFDDHVRSPANQSRSRQVPRSEDFSTVTVVDDADQLAVGAKLTADSSEWVDERTTKLSELVSDNVTSQNGLSELDVKPKTPDFLSQRQTIGSEFVRRGGPIPLGSGFSSLPHTSQKKLANFFGANPAQRWNFDDSDDSDGSSTGNLSHSTSPINPFTIISPKKKGGGASFAEIFTGKRNEIALPDPEYGSPKLKIMRRLPSSSSGKSSNAGDYGSSTRIQDVGESENDNQLRHEYCTSCRSLGADVDFACWVHRSTLMMEKRNTKWAKRWIVLKNDILYLYRSPTDIKTEGVLWLPGCRVCPVGPEYKTSKKHVFQIQCCDVSFYFYCSRKDDMVKCLNKLGLVAIGFNKNDPESTEESQYGKGYYFPGLLYDSLNDTSQKSKQQPSDLLMRKLRRSFNRVDNELLNSNENLSSASSDRQLIAKLSPAYVAGIKETRSLSTSRMALDLENKNV